MAMLMNSLLWGIGFCVWTIKCKNDSFICLLLFNKPQENSSN